MKVLKFGGTSVGSVESILSLKRIVENQKEDCIVVVSALGGITDHLIRTSIMALTQGDSYQDEYLEMRKRHRDMVNTLIKDEKKREQLLATLNSLFDELRSILYGVNLIKDLSEKTKAAIVSYGERLSSPIVAALIEGAEWRDSRKFIKTEHKYGKNSLDSQLSNQLIRKEFEKLPHITVCPGFISSDRDTGETTNLGRGGSDYTAAIIAAALDASVLEIWTDVNGFMTADPRVIPNAYTIDELSYVEATELCNFGAKVVYPPTIYPVCVKEIPIKVLNTFNPENPGTIIKSKISPDDREIKGISSIKGVALINVTGLSMVGVIGVNRRIFTALANSGISVFMVSQASSENSTSIGVQESDADQAAKVLNEEFAKEIQTGSMYPMIVEKELATVAIVGENMKHTPGIAGKLFGSLGRSGISVIACAQGASETNISFIIKGSQLSKAMNVLHDSFFLSENKVLNLFICGIGTVGGKLIEQIKQQYSTLMEKSHLELNIVGIANSRSALFNPNGLNLENYKEELKSAAPCNPQQLLKQIINMNLHNSVFVDCTASSEVAEIYQPLLEHNVSVVAANKIAASGNYQNYLKLKETAVLKGVKFLFETNVVAGRPIIDTINNLRNSGDKILKIEAVVSGTLNYIFNALAPNVPFSQTIRLAKELGYSEPDPRIDLSGKDVIRKLVILTREAGFKIEQDDVEKRLFVPDKYFKGSLEEFWQNIPQLDAEFEKMRQSAEKEGKRWRFVATMENGKGKVALQAVSAEHPFYNLADSNNIVMLTTERYKEYPMLIQGYGAGAGVTAAGVFADILSII